MHANIHLIRCLKNVSTFCMWTNCCIFNLSAILLLIFLLSQFLILLLNSWTKNMVFLMDVFLQHMPITIYQVVLMIFWEWVTSLFLSTIGGHVKITYHLINSTWEMDSIVITNFISMLDSFIKDVGEIFSTSCFLMVFTTYSYLGVSTFILAIDVSLHVAICCFCPLNLVKFWNVTNDFLKWLGN